MARTAITAQAVVDSGLNLSTEAANVDGNSIPGNGNTILYVNNGGGGAINATIVTGGTLQGKAVADTVVNIPAGQARYIGRFNSALYNDPTTGEVNVDYDSVTSVTVAAITV